MKKSLIALAVLAASGVAMAQSSVTMYGVADVGLVKSNGIPTQMSGSGVMNNGTSRLGVRGTEDLGGGLKAFFNFEHGLNLENGAGSLSGGEMWSRAAFVGLSGGFGKFQMGRALNPSFWGVAAWELTGTANYSAVANQFGFANNAAGPRSSSLFMYSTPNLGGFTANLGYATKQDNQTATVAAFAPVARGVAGASYDLSVIYANGPLAAALSYNDTKNIGGGMALGASYDFGSFKLAGSLQKQDRDGAARESKGFTLGGTVPVGPFALTVDIARDTEFKDTDILLEGKYALSKRTFAYVAYYKDGDNNGALPGGYKTGAKNHIGLGLRHNF